MKQSDIASLRLYQLISPSLPIGSFTYSQGMEWAVENAWVNNVDSLSGWLETQMKDSLAWLELPLLLRLHGACETNDQLRFFSCSHQLYVSRETNELRQEELNRARALLMVLNKLPGSENWPQLLAWRDALLKSQIAGFSLASYQWQINKKQMLFGYTWSWLENAVTVAIKLIPLGQSDGQAVLYRLAEKIPSVVESTMLVNDEDIGASTAALAIASSLHETQYTRLFRS